MHLLIIIYIQDRSRIKSQHKIKYKIHKHLYFYSTTPYKCPFHNPHTNFLVLLFFSTHHNCELVQIYVHLWHLHILLESTLEYLMRIVIIWDKPASVRSVDPRRGLREHLRRYCAESFHPVSGQTEQG